MKVDNQSIVALLGGNGTGKSTILKACSGIIRTWKGSINFNGEDIQNLPPRLFMKKTWFKLTRKRCCTCYDGFRKFKIRRFCSKSTNIK